MVVYIFCCFHKKQEKPTTRFFIQIQAMDFSCFSIDNKCGRENHSRSPPNTYLRHPDGFIRRNVLENEPDRNVWRVPADFLDSPPTVNTAETGSLPVMIRQTGSLNSGAVTEQVHENPRYFSKTEITDSGVSLFPVKCMENRLSDPVQNSISAWLHALKRGTTRSGASAGSTAIVWKCRNSVLPFMRKTP